MQQLSRHTWQIVSKATGSVIATDIHLHDRSKAVDYIKAYVSSFLGWDWEIRTLDEET